MRRPDGFEFARREECIFLDVYFARTIEGEAFAARIVLDERPVERVVVCEHQPHSM